jgi:hypothetical protein
VVQQVFDIDVVPTITLSGEELRERRSMMSAEDFGIWYKRYLDAVNANVFGASAPRDPKSGSRTEIGLGSPGNETSQSVAAYERFGRHEPNYEKVLAKKRQNLAECDARRAKEQATQQKEWWQ